MQHNKYKRVRKYNIYTIKIKTLDDDDFTVVEGTTGVEGFVDTSLDIVIGGAFG